MLELVKKINPEATPEEVLDAQTEINKLQNRRVDAPLHKARRQLLSANRKNPREWTFFTERFGSDPNDNPLLAKLPQGIETFAVSGVIGRQNSGPHQREEIAIPRIIEGGYTTFIRVKR